MNRIVVNGSEYSVSHLLDESEKLSRHLQRKYDFRPGDAALVCLANSYEHLVLTFALWRLKAEFHSLAPSSSDVLIAGVFNRGVYKVICIDGDQERRLLSSIQGLLFGDDCLSVKYTPETEVKIYSREITKIFEVNATETAPKESTFAWTRELYSQPNCTFFTSGSTGNSKGVVLEWQRILEKGRQVLDFYRATPDDCIFPLLPISHLYGLYLSIGAIDRKCDLILTRESAQPATIINSIKQNKVTILICPPLVSKFYFARGKIDPSLQDHLRIISMGGAAMPPEMLAHLRERLPRTKIIVSYGLVETYSTICAYEIQEKVKVPGLVGPIRFAKGFIARPGTSTKMPQGEIGELCITDGKLKRFADMSGDLSAHFTAEGYYRTGDLAMMDADGNVHLRGRIKEIINAGGLSIRPEEIEEVVLRHPMVQDCGAFGHTESDLEVVYLGVVLKCPDDQVDKTIQDLYNHCRDSLSVKMIPRKIIPVSKIPRGSLGKIQRKYLQEMALFGVKK